MKKLLFTLFFIAFSILLFAQDTIVTEAEREGTGMRANEKIYVVVTVVGTLLAGFLIYLIRLDRKIARMERESER